VRERRRDAEVEEELFLCIALEESRRAARIFLTTDDADFTDEATRALT
jgi:hypothetical protein